MPLDPSIALSFKPAQFADPSNRLAQMMQIQQAVQQNALTKLTMREKERAAGQMAQYQQGVGALGPNPSEESMVGLAMRFLKPADAMKNLISSRDRQATIEAAKQGRLQAAEDRRAQNEQMITLRYDQLGQTARSGEERNEIMRQRNEDLARNAQESLALRRAISAQGNKPPPGYRWTADGNQELIPGGPADQKAQQKDQGRGQISTIVDNLAAQYNELEKMGAVIKPEQTAAKNVWERAAASDVGQKVAGFVGTKAQETRDIIAQSKPLLMAAIKQASGMSAQQLNSNMELQFYLQAATDPRRSLKANRAALAVLDQSYGLGTGFSADQADIDALRKTAPRTASGGQIKQPRQGVKFLGFE